MRASNLVHEREDFAAMYMQTKCYPFSWVTWYKILRQSYRFGSIPAFRYALWMSRTSRGVESLEPGELSAWIMDQVRRHPLAAGVVLVTWAYAIIIFVWWTVTR